MSTEPATSDALTLNQVAERLGVHYMTVYRQIRTGRLPATKVGGEWLVQTADVEAREAEAPRPRRRRRWEELLATRLIDGDESGAWQVLQDCLASGHEPEDVYLTVIAPALDSIGRAWADGRIDVAQEHLASAISVRLLGRLGPLFGRRGRRRGSLVVGAPAHDLHGLPVALLADPLRGRGFVVYDLGPDVPAESWASAIARADGPLAVGLCATTPENEDEIRKAIVAIRAATDAPIVLGGSGVPDAATALQLGADHHTPDAASLLALADTLVAAKP